MRRFLDVCVVLVAGVAVAAFRAPAAASATVTIETVPKLKGVPIVVDNRV